MELLSVNLFAGSQAALSHKSALCLLGKGADRPLDPVEAGRLRAAVEALTCTDPFYGLEAADWPHCLLASPLGADRVAGWVVALAVTLQRLAYEWVGEGQVLSVGEDRTLVALPWMRRSVLDQALPMVLAHFAGLAGQTRGHGTGHGQGVALTFLAAKTAPHSADFDAHTMHWHANGLGHFVLNFGGMLG